jgi:tetratricopeptide (TPR) repeat protein
MASAYHQLGITAQERGQLDEAEDWYRKALSIDEELGNRPSKALTYAQCGLLAEDRGQSELALEWNVRCVSLFEEVPNPLTGTGPSRLVRLTRELGVPVLEETWRRVTGQALPQVVRDFIDSQPGED